MPRTGPASSFSTRSSCRIAATTSDRNDQLVGPGPRAVNLALEEEIPQAVGMSRTGHRSEASNRKSTDNIEFHGGFLLIRSSSVGRGYPAGFLKATTFVGLLVSI